jgi:hypothetical protein
MELWYDWLSPGGLMLIANMSDIETVPPFHRIHPGLAVDLPGQPGKSCPSFPKSAERTPGWSRSRPP